MKKISLKSIQNALNRDEMKQVKGGCGLTCSSSGTACFRYGSGSDICCGQCVYHWGDWGLCDR